MIRRLTQIISIIAITLLGLCFSQGFYSNGSLFRNIYQSAYTNNEARIDIHNLAGANAEVQGTDALSIEYPADNWCKKNNGDHCSVLKFQPTNDWQTRSITLKIKDSGKIRIMLRGPYRKKNGIIQPILIDYKDLKISDKTFFSEGKTIWHEMYKDKATKIPLFSVQQGEEIQLQVMIRRHPFRWSDLQEFHGVNLQKCLIAFTISLGIALLSLLLFYYIKKRFSQRCEMLSFIIIILLLLIIPVLNLSKDSISEQENRTLARFPVLIKDKKINTKFGIEFNNWLSDRFWGRNQLIDLRFNLLYRINNNRANEKAFIGDGGWMFDTKGTKYVDSIEKQEKKILKNVDILKKFIRLFDKKNIDFYLVLIPSRNKLLKKYWERYYPPRPEIEENENFITLLKDIPNIHIISPFEVLKEMNEKMPVFYKEDAHMTDTGISVINEQLFLELQKHHDELKSVHLLSEIKKKKIAKKAVSYAADLGYPAHKSIEMDVINLKVNDNKPVFNMIEEKKFSETSALYRGVENAVYVKGVTKEAPINKMAVVIGPCYSEHIFKFIKELYEKSARIRLNAFQSFPPAAKSFCMGKMRSLVKEIPNNSVIILIEDEDTFLNIEKVMNGL